jgi:hypothetical protein
MAGADGLEGGAHRASESWPGCLSVRAKQTGTSVAERRSLGHGNGPSKPAASRRANSEPCHECPRVTDVCCTDTHAAGEARVEGHAVLPEHDGIGTLAPVRWCGEYLTEATLGGSPCQG